MRTPALKKAQGKYEAKRSKHRLPSIYLNEEEYALFQRVLKKHGGSKKAAIIASLATMVIE